MKEKSTPKQYCVLCIDDESSNLTVRKLLLESAGYTALTASSGKEGLDIFDSRHVDAVIVDYSMPEMDGGVVAAQLKRLKPRVPVVMLSAYSGVRSGVEEVVDAFIEKGGEPTSLLSRLSSLINVRSHVHPEMKSEYVLCADSSRQCLDCSDAVCQLLGYSRAEIIDKTVDEISYVSDEVPALFVQPQQPGTFDGEHILKHKSGRPVPIRFRSWLFADGCRVAVLEQIRDWKELYHAAMLEFNPARLKGRLEVALLAIHHRMRELGETPSKLTGEQAALNDALNGLRILQKGGR
jgi:PAS domain S-box-containing protein